MNRTIIIAALALWLAAPAAAQKRRKAAAKAPAVSFMDEARQALQAYQFGQAEELLTKEVEALRRKKQDATEAEAMLEQAQMGLLKLHATQRIVVIDSLVCNKDEALRAIRLSSDCGRIDTYASTYHVAGASEATIYENEFGNKRYLAVPHAATDSTQGLRLASADKIGQEWASPTPLQGLNEDDLSQNYPFLLSDGVTLYYAAQGPESMGGYDIFVSRADDEEGHFLSPENMGFPYNSTANDYLLAIDESAELGWFVSDRGQPQGKVCVYTFIPSATRDTYGDSTTDSQLRALARLSSIRDTWQNAEPDAIQAARQRLETLRTGSQTHRQAAAFHFVIDDGRTYTELSQFRSADARQKMQQWLQMGATLETDATMLQRLRDNYAKATPAQRQQLAGSIRQLEATYDPRLQQQQQLAKEIRNAEIAHK